MEEFGLSNKLPLPGKSAGWEERIGEWHRSLIEQGAELLEKRGVAFELRPGTDGYADLWILPVVGKSALNDFAAEWGRRLDGLSFVYSPKDLIRRGSRSDPRKIRKARSLYQREKHTVLLPDKTVATGCVDDAVHHEVLHAEFNFLLRHGIGSLFHGWFRSAMEGVPMWGSAKYPFRMSLEELATHSLNLKFIAEELGAALAKADLEVRAKSVAAVLNKLTRKARTLEALASHSELTLFEALARFDTLKIRFFQEESPAPKGELRPPGWIVWAEYFLSGMQVKMPLLALSDRSAFAALLRGDQNGLKALHSSLRVRMQTLCHVAGLLAMAGRQLVQATANETAALASGEGESRAVENLLGVARRPRDITASFIHWGN